MSKFRIGDKITHKTDGGKYEIQATPNAVKIKNSFGEWVPGYIYTGIDKNSSEACIFVREQKDFEENFVEISGFCLKVHLKRGTFFEKNF